MSDPFVAEIRLVPFNFAPVGWAFCSGQLLPISQNTALFSLLGTQYGGDGRTTFGLPNLQGRAAMHTTQYASSPLGQFVIGEQGGEDSVALLTSQMPSHTHTVSASTVAGRLTSPSGNVLAPTGRGASPVYAAASTTTMSPLQDSAAGGSQPHNNLMPYLVLNYIIALQGIYPPRA